MLSLAWSEVGFSKHYVITRFVWTFADTYNDLVVITKGYSQGWRRTGSGYTYGDYTITAKCKFPFTYDGKTYKKCAGNKPWCYLDKDNSYYTVNNKRYNYDNPELYYDWDYCFGKLIKTISRVKCTKF